MKQASSISGAARHPITLLARRLALVLAASLLIALPHAAPVQAQESEGSASNAELVELLQGGGLILYVRHGATDHSQADRDVGDLNQCEMQRNLSQKGKDESATMGAAIGALGIPVGAVLSSPYCRAVDTARIAFGRYEVDDMLRATFFTSAEETRAINAYLRELLSVPPAPGTNTVILGHTANLDDVTRVWPKPEGVAHVFRPLGDGGFQHLGRITPDNWAALLEAG